MVCVVIQWRVRERINVLVSWRSLGRSQENVSVVTRQLWLENELQTSLDKTSGTFFRNRFSKRKKSSEVQSPYLWSLLSFWYPRSQPTYEFIVIKTKVTLRVSLTKRNATLEFNVLSQTSNLGETDVHSLPPGMKFRWLWGTLETDFSWKIVPR